jgi:Flp pilus assembly protein TadG
MQARRCGIFFHHCPRMASLSLASWLLTDIANQPVRKGSNHRNTYRAAPVLLFINRLRKWTVVMEHRSAEKPCNSGVVLYLQTLNKGQALVEFTLVFILLLIVAWIPADFGLAFYTGQLALNASREGARIGAADPNYPAQVGTCTLPACYSLTNGTILKETGERLSSALLPGATVTVFALTGAACNQTVQVQVVGNYNFFFYRLLRFFGVDVPPTLQINRVTQMRWEHQNSCT